MIRIKRKSNQRSSLNVKTLKRLVKLVIFFAFLGILLTLLQTFPFERKPARNVYLPLKTTKKSIPTTAQIDTDKDLPVEEENIEEVIEGELKITANKAEVVKETAITEKKCEARSTKECSLPKCLLGASCRPNQYYRHAVANGTEGSCFNRKSDQRPTFSNNASALESFKYYSSWMFEKYFDFSADCSKVTFPSMTARHNDQKLYELNNVCISPLGPLSGFNPKTKGFEGEDDVYYTGIGPGLKDFRKYLRSVAPLERAPKCFYDLNIVLFPIMYRSENVGHMFHRTGSMMRLIEAAFPPGSNVTVVYVVLGDEGRYLVNSDKARRTMNGLSFYYQLLSTSYAAVWSFQEEPSVIGEAIGGRFSMEQMRTPVCFKRAFAWYNMMSTRQRGTSGPTPGSQLQFSLLGPRSTWDKETMSLITKRICQCFNTEKRKEPNRKHPLVYYALRTYTRTFLHQGEAIPKMGDYLTQTGGSLETVEHYGMAPSEIVERHVQADIVMGMYGAGLFWHVLGPPGTVVLEINYRGKRFSDRTGINLHPSLDYGGNAYTSEGQHIVFATPDSLRREMAGGWEYFVHYDRAKEKTDLDFPPDLMVELVRVAVCVLRNPASCEYIGKFGGGYREIHEITYAHINDASGTVLLSLLRETTTPFMPLDHLFPHFVPIANIFRPYRQGKPLRVLEISLPCDVSRRYFGHWLWMTKYVPTLEPTVLDLTQGACQSAEPSEESISQMKDLQPHFQASRSFFATFSCEGSVEKLDETLSLCGVVGSLFDVIITTKSIVDSHIGALRNILSSSGSIVTLYSATEQIPPVEIRHHAPPLENDKLIQHASRLLSAGSADGFDEKLVIPALGIVVEDMTVDMLRAMLLSLNIGVRHLFFSYSTLTRKDVVELLYRIQDACLLAVHVLEHEAFNVALGYRSVIDASFTKDLTAEWMMVIARPLVIPRRFLREFVERSHRTGHIATFYLCPRKKLDSVFTIYRRAYSIIGPHDAAMALEATMEYDIRATATGYETQIFTPGNGDATSGPMAGLCTDLAGTGENTMVGVLRRRFSSSSYLRKKWDVGRAKSHPTFPFHMERSYPHLTNTLEDKNYLHCLQTGTGTLDNCGRCWLDILHQIPGNLLAHSTIAVLNSTEC